MNGFAANGLDVSELPVYTDTIYEDYLQAQKEGKKSPLYRGTFELVPIPSKKKDRK